MRKLFWILLLANALLFAAMQQGWLAWDDEPQAQPALNRDKIRLLESAQNSVQSPAAGAKPALNSAAAAKSAAAHPPVPASAPVAAAPPPASPAPSVASAAAPVCMEWGDFSGPDLLRSTAALASLKLGDRLSQRQVVREVGYWVYIPPLKDKAAVRRTVAELKALGISEYFVVQTAGHWRNAISLGVFKTREAAQNDLDQLRTKGVHTAKVGERVSRVKVTIFGLASVDPETAAKLAALQNDFAGSELKTVPCALTR
jgi:hypothetical protein